jgi:hypothetical protein
MSRYRTSTEERLTWSVGAVVVSLQNIYIYIYIYLRRHTYADDEVRCHTLLIDSIRTCRRPIMDANASDKSITGLDCNVDINHNHRPRQFSQVLRHRPGRSSNIDMQHPHLYHPHIFCALPPSPCHGPSTNCLIASIRQGKSMSELYTSKY